MSIQDYISRKQELQNYILTYIDNDEDSEDDYTKIMDYLTSNQISTNQKELYELLKLLSAIINNHRRNQGFYNKISRIFELLTKDIKQFFSNLELFNIFKDSLLILPFLFETQIIKFDYQIFHYFMEEILSKKDGFLFSYFLPEIKTFIPSLNEQLTKKDNEPRIVELDKSKNDENEFITTIISKGLNEIETDFYDKRKKGENDSYISELIRQDSIDDFIIYINQNNISLSSLIERSIFETNSFLLKNKEVSLIEYAAFYGSIQIFKYLEINKVELKPSLWLYAIHSQNSEIFSFLEEKNNEKTDAETKFKWLKEAIKCHHNDIANYIIQQFDLTQIISQFCDFCFHYYNYDMISEEFEKNTIIENVIRYDHLSFFAGENGSHEIIQFLLKQPEITIEDCAFQGSTKLIFITIPSSIKRIGKQSFYGCSSLIQVIFEEESNLELIDDYSFFCCRSLAKVTIPSSVTTIGKGSFEDCISLKKFKIEQPTQLKTIKINSFNGCKQIFVDKKTKEKIKSLITNFYDEKFILLTEKNQQQSELIPFYKHNEKEYTRITLVGYLSVGKTSIITRYVQDQFNDHVDSTIAADNSRIEELSIWDTSGKEDFECLLPMYTKGSKSVMFVFDLSNLESFHKLIDMKKELNNSINDKDTLLLLVGNKCDLKREVNKELAENFAIENNMIYFEVSAKSNSGVDDIFNFVKMKCDSKFSYLEIKYHHYMEIKKDDQSNVLSKCSIF